MTDESPKIPEFGMEEESARNAYRNLRESITCFGWSADAQIAWLREHRVPGDEFVVSLFNDNYPVVWALRERGWFPPEVDTIIESMERLLDEVDLDDSDEGIRTDARWAKLRTLAQQALALLPAEPRML